jgi:hypothetical protein
MKRHIFSLILTVVVVGLGAYITPILGSDLVENQSDADTIAAQRASAGGICVVIGGEDSSFPVAIGRTFY